MVKKVAQTHCPRCKTEFPKNFSNALSGQARIIQHDDELSVIIDFDCPECDAALVLEDARGPSFGINPQKD